MGRHPENKQTYIRTTRTEHVPTETRQRQGGRRKDEGGARKCKDVPFSWIHCVAFGGRHDLGNSASPLRKFMSFFELVLARLIVHSDRGHAVVRNERVRYV